MEIKHDTLHRTWHRLSVGLKDVIAEAGNREALQHGCRLHLWQYAVDHQMNHHMLAVRAVKKETGEVIVTYASDAMVNRQ